MVAKTWGKTVDDATIVPTAMVSVVLGSAGNGSAGRSPGTRGKQAAMLRAELIKAQENAAKKDAPKDLKSDIMMRVIKGEVRLLITAHKDQDIMTALRFPKEFNLNSVGNDPLELDVSARRKTYNQGQAIAFSIPGHDIHARADFAATERSQDLLIPTERNIDLRGGNLEFVGIRRGFNDCHRVPNRIAGIGLISFGE